MVACLVMCCCTVARCLLTLCLRRCGCGWRQCVICWGGCSDPGVQLLQCVVVLLLYWRIVGHGPWGRPCVPGVGNALPACIDPACTHDLQLCAAAVNVHGWLD